jgi:HSP20 family protein
MLPITFTDGLFPSLFDDIFYCGNTNAKMTPATNVKEYSDKYVMDIAAPGIKKEFCNVSINDDGNLSVTIENKHETKNEDKQHKYLRKEFSFYSYHKDYTLPEDTDKDNISAKVENGILTVTLPKVVQKPKNNKMIEVL